MLRVLNIATDMPKLLVIEQATQIAPWTLETFQKCLDAGSKAYVYEVEQELIGFIFVLSQAGEGHILNVSVHPDHQRRGYGYELINEVFRALKAEGSNIAYLEVRKGNAKAIALYKKLGFIQIGERKNYYIGLENKEDALVFAKDLSKE
jgi:ribosomal-protein-alanine N-acetyltransferase